MPFASFKTAIHASYDQVSALLVDKMEKPKKYVGSILYSNVLERGDGFLGWRTHWHCHGCSIRLGHARPCEGVLSNSSV